MAADESHLSYWIGKTDERALRLREFECAAHRSVAERIERGFIHTYKPVMDDAPYRIFSTMQEYTQWCEQSLPRWLGYARTASR